MRFQADDTFRPNDCVVCYPGRQIEPVTCVKRYLLTILWEAKGDRTLDNVNDLVIRMRMRIVYVTR